MHNNMKNATKEKKEQEKKVINGIGQETIDELSNRFIKHLSISERAKKTRLESWKRVDEFMANNKVAIDDDTEVHVPLGKGNGFMETWLSKIDNPLIFKYIAPEIADDQKAKAMNSIRESDSKRGKWNIKDLLGKDQVGKYGRAIFFYQAKSPKGKYESQLENIDVVRYHHDINAGGSDKENARWLGWDKVLLTKEELEDGVKSGIYIKEKVDSIINAGSAGTYTENDTDKYEDYRFKAVTGSMPDTKDIDEDVFRFYRWFETINSTRYTFLTTQKGEIIGVEKWDGLWPIWTWSAYMSLTVFWSLSPLEYNLYNFIAQEASISQLIENADRRNNPQKAVQIEKIKNISQLKSNKKARYIEVDGDVDVNQAVKEMPVPSLDNAIAVYEKLNEIAGIESGVTAGAMGVADEDKVAIYEGNMSNAGDRFGRLSKAYTDGYYDFAELHYDGVMNNLTRSMSVKIIGVEGLKIKKFTKKDLKTKDRFDILVESSNAEAESNNIDKKNKITFLAGYKGDQNINQKVLFEYGAQSVGFADDEIKRLLDVSDNATTDIVAEAHRTFQELLDGEDVDDNLGADTVFVEELNKLYWDNRKDLSEIDAMNIENYIERQMPIVMQNMERRAVSMMAKGGMIDPNNPEAGMTMGDGMAKGNGQISRAGQNLQDPESFAPAQEMMLGNNQPQV